MSRRIRARDLDRVVAAIVSDVEASRRHWAFVRDAAAVRMNDATAPDRWRSNARDEHAVAVAVLAYIDRTGRAPRELTMAGARRELGL